MIANARHGHNRENWISIQELDLNVTFAHDCENWTWLWVLIMHAKLYINVRCGFSVGVGHEFEIWTWMWEEDINVGIGHEWVNSNYNQFQSAISMQFAGTFFYIHFLFSERNILHDFLEWFLYENIASPNCS